MVNQPLTRREFLGTTAAAGAGLLLSSCSPDSKPKPAAAKNSPLSKINVALIGCGAQGQVLLDSLQVDVGPAIARLGWTPPVDVETGIRRAVAPLLASSAIADK